MRALCTKYDVPLVIDETHTICAGPGGCTKAWGLDPDFVTIGKTLGAGIPSAAYGMTTEVADRIYANPEYKYADVAGIGGTLAGNALSMAAARATLGQVLTDEAFARMDALCVRLTDLALDTVARHGMPWTVTRLGARAEYRFCAPAPRNGTESAAADDPDLDEYLHLAMSNRGVLITPFHNMVLMCPETTEADVDLHGELFEEAVARLAG